MLIYLQQQLAGFVSYYIEFTKQNYLHIQNRLTMDIRKMKLALTVELMNLNLPQNPLIMAQKAMQKFKDEVGKFNGLFFAEKSVINLNFERQTAALQFERCTLNLELVTDVKSQVQYIQGFNLKPILP